MYKTCDVTQPAQCCCVLLSTLFNKCERVTSLTQYNVQSMAKSSSETSIFSFCNIQIHFEDPKVKIFSTDVYLENVTFVIPNCNEKNNFVKPFAMNLKCNINTKEYCMCSSGCTYKWSSKGKISNLLVSHSKLWHVVGTWSIIRVLK